MFYKNGVLPWDMAPIPALAVDDKDPLIYKKTMEHQAAQRKWDEKYVKRKNEISYEILTYGMPT